MKVKEIVMNHLETYGEVEPDVFARENGVPEEEVRQVLQDLVDQGIVEEDG